MVLNRYYQINIYKWIQLRSLQSMKRKIEIYQETAERTLVIQGDHLILIQDPEVIVILIHQVTADLIPIEEVKVIDMKETDTTEEALVLLE